LPAASATRGTAGASGRRSAFPPLTRAARVLEGALFAGVLIPLARWAPALSRMLRPFFVWCTWLALPSRRRALRRTAEIVLGRSASWSDRSRHGRRVMTNIQAFIADVATIDRRSVMELAATIARFEGLDHLMGPLRAGQPIVMCGAHLGSFESSVAALRAVSAVPIHVVFAHDALGAFERARRRARRHLGIVEHAVDRGVETWLALREALGRGEVVAILADRLLPMQRGVVVPFFEVPAELPNGPLRLAAATGALVVPTFAIPVGNGRSILRFEPAIRVPDDGSPLDATHPAMSTLVAAMERAIRAAPDHWLVVDVPWVDRPRIDGPPVEDRSRAQGAATPPL